MATVLETPVQPDVDRERAVGQGELSQPMKRQPKKKSLRQKVTKEAVMLMRRIHLFSGLFMFPWVLLYGFTGWFFNHPTYFSSDEVRTFRGETIADGALASLPDPSQLASRVVEEINLESFMVDGPEVVLTDRFAPQFDRYLSFSVNTEQQSHRIEIHPVTGDGIVRTTHLEPSLENEAEAADAVPRNPLESVNNVELAENTHAIAASKVPELLTALGLSSAEASAGRFSSSLLFSADVNGIPSKVTYNMGNGAITALADEAPRSAMSAKSFSQRLHLSRGYAPSMGTRTWWAISVDAMFFSMVFWGFSGIFMWWQIKRTRGIGLVVLAASAICATWLVVGMHEELGSRTRGRGSGSRQTVATRSTAASQQTDAAPSSGNGSTAEQESLSDEGASQPGRGRRGQGSAGRNPGGERTSSGSNNSQ